MEAKYGVVKSSYRRLPHTGCVFQQDIWQLRCFCIRQVESYEKPISQPDIFMEDFG